MTDVDVTINDVPNDAGQIIQTNDVPPVVEVQPTIFPASTSAAPPPLAVTLQEEHQRVHDAEKNELIAGIELLKVEFGSMIDDLREDLYRFRQDVQEKMTETEAETEKDDATGTSDVDRETEPPQSLTVVESSDNEPPLPDDNQQKSFLARLFEF